MTEKRIPIDTRHLFKPLQKELIALLKSLNEEDWHKQTVAKAWKVKDVVSHMLDGQLRVLSMQRDRFFGEQPPTINGYEDLVGWLNQLNAGWVAATKRLSPRVLILLLESVGNLVSDYYESLDPWDEAIFAVSWAGESTSYNWMHLAREYTEYWHHQQQVREATNRPGIMTREFFFPFMDTFFQALPHTFQEVSAPAGTLVKASVSSDAGGSWYLKKQQDGWQLIEAPAGEVDAAVTIPVELSWVLFSKSVRPHEVIDQIQIEGDEKLATRVLEMVSVMA